MNLDMLKTRSSSKPIFDNFNNQIYIGSPIICPDYNGNLMQAIVKNINSNGCITIFENLKRYHRGQIISAEKLLDISELNTKHTNINKRLEQLKEEKNKKISYRSFYGFYREKNNKNNFGKIIFLIPSEPGKKVSQKNIKDKCKEYTKLYSDIFDIYYFINNKYIADNGNQDNLTQNIDYAAVRSEKETSMDIDCNTYFSYCPITKLYAFARNYNEQLVLFIPFLNQIEFFKLFKEVKFINTTNSDKDSYLSIYMERDYSMSPCYKNNPYVYLQTRVDVPKILLSK